ncbi:MAG: hypothetical protein ACLGGX_01675 [Bdellovibrionia bacterium]
MENTSSDHEKIFNHICNQLNELSQQQSNEAVDSSEEILEVSPAMNAKYEVMQNHMKKFNSELLESQEEIKNKIKNLGSVTFGAEALDQQIRQLAEQLSNERNTNSKLSSDLAKSLELSLQLQLEIQNLKSRNLQIQTEEKKYSAALLERAKVLQRDLELNLALKDETSMELAKAKNAFYRESQVWEQTRNQYEAIIQSLRSEIAQLQNNKQQLEQELVQQKESHTLQINEMTEQHQQALADKESEIEGLNLEIESVQNSFKEVEESAQQQNEVLNNLMSVAEGKIVEMKMALDKKTIEAQDYYSHLQQALTQLAVARQENATLKDYVNKLNAYHQQAMGHMASQLTIQTSPDANQGK